MQHIRTMPLNGTLLAVLAATALTGFATAPANAQIPAAVVQSLGTPDKVETRIGTLDFKDGTARRPWKPRRRCMTPWTSLAP